MTHRNTRRDDLEVTDSLRHPRKDHSRISAQQQPGVLQGLFEGLLSAPAAFEVCRNNLSMAIP